MIKSIIIEDDLNIASLHKRFLEKNPVFEMLAIATSVKDGLDLIYSLKPDLVLLDLYLKDGFGLDILDDIRKNNLDIDFIIISAAKDIVTVKSVMHKGVFDYLIKPIVLDRLQDSLNKYITFFNTIKTKSEVDQKDIDMTIKNINIDKDDIPKGIDEITLKKILKVLEEASDYLTADEIGDKIGASRNTARRYLEYLMEINVVEVNTNYGKIGRPEREFILVSKKSKNNKM